jgi:hypothetical protein
MELSLGLGAKDGGAFRVQLGWRSSARLAQFNVTLLEE